MKRPSSKQIADEIVELKRIRPLVREMSIFGDDHRQNIGIIIEVLEGPLTEDQIYDLWNFSNRDAALEARRWLDGEWNDGSPSASYAELIPKEAKTS